MSDSPRENQDKEPFEPKKALDSELHLSEEGSTELPSVDGLASEETTSIVEEAGNVVEGTEKEVEEEVEEKVENAGSMGSKLESFVAQKTHVATPDTPSSIKLRRLYVLSACLFVFVMLGFLGLSFYYWQLMQKVERLDQSEQVSVELKAMSQAILSNKHLVESAGESIQAQAAVFEKAVLAKVESELTEAKVSFRSITSKSQQQVDMLQQRVDGHQQRLLSLSTTSREDWMLAEAEYLLKLANQRVLLERTAENAVALLESADQIVAQVSAGTGDAELFAIRKAISRDLTALKLIEPVDRDGVYLKLQALAEKLDALPRVPGHGLQESDHDLAGLVSDGQGDSESASDLGLTNKIWRELKAMAGTLNQYIKIEDATAPVKPLVDQHFTQMAGLNVRLLIEQAQIALLKESDIIYRNSLVQASELIGSYYIPSKAAREFQSTLSEFASLNVAPTLPDISSSLQLLHAYIRQLHKIQGSSEVDK